MFSYYYLWSHERAQNSLICVPYMCLICVPYMCDLCSHERAQNSCKRTYSSIECVLLTIECVLLLLPVEPRESAEQLFPPPNCGFYSGFPILMLAGLDVCHIIICYMWTRGHMCYITSYITCKHKSVYCQSLCLRISTCTCM